MHWRSQRLLLWLTVTAQDLWEIVPYWRVAGDQDGSLCIPKAARYLHVGNWTESSVSMKYNVNLDPQLTYRFLQYMIRCLGLSLDVIPG